MDALKILEAKIAVLVDLVKNLKEENNNFKKKNEELEAKNMQLIKEGDALQKDISSLHEELKMLESSVHTNSKTVEALNGEKVDTKVAIEDLIKDIDTLVENSN